MRLEDFFRKAPASSIQHDPRGKKVVLHNLETKRKDCDAFRPAEKNHLNSIIAGDIASDNLGLNLLLDKMIRNKTFEIIECSGFRMIYHYS